MLGLHVEPRYSCGEHIDRSEVHVHKLRCTHIEQSDLILRSLAQEQV